MNKVDIITAKIKKINQDISRMHSLREISDYIPAEGIEKFAFILLIVWNLSPILTMLHMTSFGQNTDQFAEMTTLLAKNIFWLTMLQQVGLIGCLLGILALSKSIIRARTVQTRLGDYLTGHAFPIFLFLMLIWSVFSCLFSGDINLSFYGTLFRNEGLLAYICYAGIFICAFQIKKARLVYGLLNCFTAIATLISILSLINSKLINQWFGLTQGASIFNNENHYAYYLCLAIMASLYLLLRENQQIRRLAFRFAAFGLICAALVINHSFGPYLAVLAGLAITVIFVFKSQKDKKLRLVLAVSLFLAISLVINLFFNYLFSDFGILLDDSMNILTGSADAANAGSYRWFLWVNGLSFIAERPFFGFGPDNLGAQYLAAGTVIDRPHNELIQFAASLGLPALIFYLSALITLLISFIKQKWLTTLIGIGFFAMIATYLASSLLGNTMFYTTPYFLIILGLSGSLLKIRASDKDQYPGQQ